MLFRSGIFDVKVAADKIREICPTAVNSNCGLHVTVDVSDHSAADIKRLIVGYLKAQEHFYTECNESRQSNRYCKRNPTASMASAIKSGDPMFVATCAGGWARHEDRYHGLNLTRLFSKKVVEFRMMESTVSARKLGQWIRQCVGFVDGLKKSGVAFKSTDAFSRETFDKIVEGTWRL